MGRGDAVHANRLRGLCGELRPSCALYSTTSYQLPRPLASPHSRPSRINDTDKLAGLRAFAKDPAFQAKWHAVKQAKKAKLAALIKRVHGDDDINLNALFDIQVGRVLVRAHARRGNAGWMVG